jgi:hypothetical protein
MVSGNPYGRRERGRQRAEPAIPPRHGEARHSVRDMMLNFIVFDSTGKKRKI